VAADHDRVSPERARSRDIIGRRDRAASAAEAGGGSVHFPPALAVPYCDPALAASRCRAIGGG
jgi:hypothetical protein